MGIELERMRQKAQAAREAAEEKRLAEWASTGWRPSHAILMTVVKSTDHAELAKWDGKFNRAYSKLKWWLNEFRLGPESAGGDAERFGDPAIIDALNALYEALVLNTWLNSSNDLRLSEIREKIKDLWARNCFWLK